MKMLSAVILIRSLDKGVYPEFEFHDAYTVDDNIHVVIKSKNDTVYDVEEEGDLGMLVTAFRDGVKATRVKVVE